MQGLQLILNDQEADLSEDSPIALTFQINNLADVANQAGNTSNQFKLPLTQKNRRICGFVDDIRFTDNTPYTQLAAKIIINGIEVIPNGIGEITDADQGSISVTVLSGNVDFFDAISEKIYNLGDSTTLTGVSGVNKPMAKFNHTWNLATVVNSRFNLYTDGYIYPIIDYGLFPTVQPYTIDVRQLRPAFYIRAMIDIIIGQTGYKAAGSLLSDPLYNRLMCAFSNDNFEHGTDYQNAPDLNGMAAQTTADQGYSVMAFTNNVDVKGIFNFGLITVNPDGNFDGTYFTAGENYTATVLLTIPKFYFYGKVNDNPSNVNIIIYLETPDGVLQFPLNYDLSGGFTRDNSPGAGSGSQESGYNTFGTMKLSTDIDFLPGYRMSIRYELLGNNPSSFIMYAGAALTVTAKNQDVQFGQEVQCERIFPDITQKDLLKDTLQRHAIICQTDNTNKTVTFTSLKDIIKNIPIAKDWSAKCLNVGKQNNFVLGSNYAQVNNLIYTPDDAITLGFADDAISINDKTLSTTATTLIQSQFAPSLNSPFYGGLTAQIIKIDNTQDGTDFTISTQPRILVSNKVNLYVAGQGQNVNFTDGTDTLYVNDVVDCPYFYKPGGEFNLAWKDIDGQPGLKTIYYAELQKLLNKTKLVTRFFNLTPRDIAELDLTIPVYLEQDNAYFYINQVYQWRKGQSCKVQLVKIGEI